MKVIGVQFETAIKAYDFDPGENEVKLNDKVLVETVQGKEVGTVVYVAKEIKKGKSDDAIKEIIKVLDFHDKEKLKENKKRAAEDFDRIVKLVERVKLPINVLKIDYSIVDDRLDIFFSADGRVDFRNAVRDLSKILGTTIRLRQLGSRDQAKVLGGFGHCGREFCCKSFLLAPTGIGKEEAERISGSKNLSKALGACGNIRCCLNYEIVSKK